MTLTPVRVKGVGGATSGDVGLIMEYHAPDGAVWPLVGPPDDDYQYVFLIEDGVRGLSASAERGRVESVSRYGARPSGWKMPPLEIELDYAIRAPVGELESVMRSWRQAWETEEPGDYGSPSVVKRGRLIVATPEGGRFWTSISSPEFPEWPSSLKNRRIIQETVHCIGYLGHWFGESEYFTGTFTFKAEGDKPLSPALRLRWDGSATSITFPSGFNLNLAAIGAERFINLDRGMSGQMTRPDETVDTLGWSSLQGLVHGMSLRPGSESTWSLGAGLTLEVTPRYLSPWR